MKTIPCWAARELAYECRPGEIVEIDGSSLVLVGTENLEDSRWSSNTRVALWVRTSGCVDVMYAFDYKKGLTEQQDYDTFDYDEPVRIFRVAPVPKTVIEFIEVND